MANPTPTTSTTSATVPGRGPAESRVAAALQSDSEDAKPEELQRLVHELSVHQAELEMQNDELSRSQQALEDSRARFIDLFDSAPVGFVVCGLDGVISDSNRTASQLTGLSPAGLRGRRLSELLVAADRQTLVDRFGRLMTRAGAQSCEVRLDRTGRPAAWVKVHMMLSAGEPDRSRMCRIALTDISERMEIQQRVLRLAAIVDSSDDAIVSRDLDGVISSWNAGAERLLGYPAHEMIGKTLDVLAPQTRGEAPLRRLLRQSQAVPHFDTELLTREGTLAAVSVSVSPVRDDKGRIFGTAMIARDISGRIGAEQALHRRLRQLDLLSRTGQALIMSDTVSADTLADVFRRVATAVGAEIYIHFQPGEAIGSLELATSMGLTEPQLELIRTIGLGGGLCGIVAARRESVVVENLQRSDAPGAEAWRQTDARCYAGFPLLASGMLMGMVAFATTSRDRFVDGDLQVIQTVCDQISTTIERARLFTEIQANERALKEADRKKDHFIATLAHELRNPLAPINNSVALLQRISEPTPAQVSVLETMRRQVGHMVRLVDDLLEVSRITLGKIVLRTERVELMQVVRNAIDISRPLIEAGNHKLVVTAPPEPLFVDADLVRLAQVFANLLNNSAKYTEPGGEIGLTVRRDGTAAVVCVRDTGAGISAELLPHVFELFTQGSSSRYAQSGLGIGLTLVRALAEMHGGRVEATSAGSGKGSEFIVRLPLAAQQTPVAATYTAPSAPLTAAQCRVLLVDDNRDAANSLGELLGFLGASVEILYDGYGVEAALARFDPNVVILDIGMPGMDGYEVARSIRDNPRYRDVMLIALTGWGTHEDQRRSRRAGFDHHLVKPADLDVLQRLLREAAHDGTHPPR